MKPNTDLFYAAKHLIIETSNSWFACEAQREGEPHCEQVKSYKPASVSQLCTQKLVLWTFSKPMNTYTIFTLKGQFIQTHF